MPIIANTNDVILHLYYCLGKISLNSNVSNTSSTYLKSNITKYTLVNKTLDHIIMGEEVLQKYFYM